MLKYFLLLLLFPLLSSCSDLEKDLEIDVCKDYCSMISECSHYKISDCLNYCEPDIQKSLDLMTQECYELYSEGYICQSDLTCMEWSEFWEGDSPYPCENVEEAFYYNCPPLKNDFYEINSMFIMDMKKQSWMPNGNR